MCSGFGGSSVSSGLSTWTSSDPTRIQQSPLSSTLRSLRCSVPHGLSREIKVKPLNVNSRCPACGCMDSSILSSDLSLPVRMFDHANYLSAIHVPCRRAIGSSIRAVVQPTMKNGNRIRNSLISFSRRASALRIGAIATYPPRPCSVSSVLAKVVMLPR